MNGYKSLVLACAIFLLSVPAYAVSASTFDDLLLAPESYWNGVDTNPMGGSGTFGGFMSGNNYFTNYKDAEWNYWEGFGYSNITDTTTSGMAGQFNAIAGGGAGGSSNYAISYVGFYGSPQAQLSDAARLQGAYFINNNYAYYSMLNGDGFAKKFGGLSGNDPDWFKLSIFGKDASNQSTGTVDFYLADYRFADNSLDYIVDEWAWVDLTNLGEVKSLEFSLSSSDTGTWGMNTPAYFALDSLTPVPEPASCLLLGSGLGLFAFFKRKKKV